MNTQPPTPDNNENLSDLGRAMLASEAARPGSKPSGAWMPPTAEELQKELPQYQITKMLGRGGMGAVYMGRQTSLDRPVAIKILSGALEEADRGFTERFKNEARAMAKLNHPGIVGVFDFGETASGLLYIVMEFVDGTDVAKMIAKEGRLHTEHAMAITAHVCDALSYAHERGIIHRDIKPANIMVGYDGVVKVADFGLAKVSASGATSGLTQSNVVMGTLHYMAPEALLLGSAVDHRADIYAVGVMLYQMLTGKIPQGMFELPSLQVKGLDPRYDGIIAKALREDRDKRYASATELRHDLDAILTQPVVKVEEHASQAPAALNTQARPKRPGGAQPYRPPHPPKVIVRTEKKGSPLLWVGFIAMACLAGWLVVKDSKKVGEESPDASVSAAPGAFPVSTGPVIAGPPTATTANPAEASKDRPFVNSLGMKFVPVPGTKALFCIHEVRYKDYSVYAKENPAIDPTWKNQEHYGFKVRERSEDHPVVGISWEDAMAYCAWLSKKEGKVFRLPSDHEWSLAVGIGKEENPSLSPDAKSGRITGYPWGFEYPPTKGAGNYSDLSRRSVSPLPAAGNIAAYEDGFVTTAPVMSFGSNAFGLYDLGGNAREWVLDLFKPGGDRHVMRGCSWDRGNEDLLRSSRRDIPAIPYRMNDCGFRVIIELPDAEPESPVTTKPATPRQATVAPLPPAAPKSSEPQLPTGPTTWTDTKGRSITATFKAIASGNVLLDIAGKVTPVPLNTLSEASRKQALDTQAGVPALTGTSAADLASGFIDLLSPEEAGHWKQCGPGRMTIAEGVATCSNPEKWGVAWYSRRMFSDFVLKAEFKATTREFNSGIWLRFSEPGQDINAVNRDKYEVSIVMDDHDVRWPTGSIHRNQRCDQEVMKPGDWNEFEIAVVGQSYTVTLNGTVVNRFTGNRNFSGYIGLEENGEKNTFGPVQFRNVQIKDLKASASVPSAPIVPASNSLVAVASRTGTSPVTATKDRPFVNSLGMKFVPVPGTRVLMCIHETRKMDYTAFSMENTGVNGAWKNVVSGTGIPVSESDDHPVVEVNLTEARQFCAWLSRKDRLSYRLPTDREWSFAVGIADRESSSSSPSQLHGAISDRFPWGEAWPPPTGSGNYGDASLARLSRFTRPVPGYNDGFATTSPVMSFNANSLGIHDLGGNALEWCDDEFGTKTALLRGSSWFMGERQSLLASHRNGMQQDARSPQTGFRVVLEVSTASSASSLHAPTSTPQMSAPGSSELANSPATATKDSPFVNSLGMKFVPVPGTKVLFCIHETRRRDYQKYAVANAGVSDRWLRHNGYSLPPDEADDHPIMYVSRNEASTFCAWLTQQEKHLYRLPTDREWSIAAGLDSAEDKTSSPQNLHAKSQLYPWGMTFPPPSRFANYATSTGGPLSGYQDDAPLTSKVMQYKPDRHGLYDLAGNMWEWVSDPWDSEDKMGITRGGSWRVEDPQMLLSSWRQPFEPDGKGISTGFRVVIEVPGVSP